MRRCCFSLAILLACVVNAYADDTKFTQADYEYFERKIRPLLVEHCYECHSSGAKTVHGGLKLDSAHAIAHGGDSGTLFNQESPEESLFVEVLNYDGLIEMPPKGKLPAEVIAEFKNWAKLGAPFPPSTDVATREGDGIDFEAGRKHWSFQPLKQHELPQVQHHDWPQTRIDHFLLAAMEREHFAPSPQANRTTLIRRLSFDLLGLPPTPEQVQSFVEDQSPDAYKKLVEDMLASPHYGEKWGRMWLDMARYTDKTASWLYASDQSHRYRDWVINAFNEDMPYDEFVHRQLATDLMPETGPEDMPALGFLSLSPTYWKELKLPCEIIKMIVADEWEERVDAVSRTFLGLTVACARCHDHKFDPVSSEDYYALAGVFASCKQTERPMIAEDLYAPVREAKAEVKKLQDEIAKLKKEKPVPQEKIDEINKQIDEIKTSTPHYDAPLANAVSEESIHIVRAGKTPQDGTRLDYRPEPLDLPLYIRGNPNRPGPVVQRRFLTVLSDETEPTPFSNGSGRLELAQSITTDAAPLAARVIVNRIWLGHFGRGLVTTPSNFGTQGAAPSHPELLDDLAARFVANNWSIKELHREIVLSATWQQSSAFDSQKVEQDPDNVWLSRMNLRRLDFEAWRDAILSATGVLKLDLGGPSIDVDDPKNLRRTIYSTVHRRDMATTLTIHDFPDPTQHSPKRSSTTTSLQGLYALNGPLLTQQSDALHNRLTTELGKDNAARITRAYQLLFARDPSDDERQLGLSFLVPGDDEGWDARWKQYAHVLLASNELLFVD